MGGRCQNCHYNKCLSALEFHHTDDNKDRNVRDFVRGSLSKAIKEAKKCILLCANCHREEHERLKENEKRT